MQKFLQEAAVIITAAFLIGLPIGLWLTGIDEKIRAFFY